MLWTISFSSPVSASPSCPKVKQLMFWCHENILSPASWCTESANSLQSFKHKITLKEILCRKNNGYLNMHLLSYSVFLSSKQLLMFYIKPTDSNENHKESIVYSLQETALIKPAAAFSFSLCFQMGLRKMAHTEQCRNYLKKRQSDYFMKFLGDHSVGKNLHFNKIKCEPSRKTIIFLTFKDQI